MTPGTREALLTTYAVLMSQSPKNWRPEEMAGRMMGDGHKVLTYGEWDKIVIRANELRASRAKPEPASVEPYDFSADDGLSS